MIILKRHVIDLSGSCKDKGIDAEIKKGEELGYTVTSDRTLGVTRIVALSLEVKE